ncbi:hypothetical protein [Aquimarina sp. AU58]|uniref:hypothetical protein n=1 Tax=Aquimarina sp. AU58 TaxID=1874112 RepID=UPI000D6E9689|nr:hypothetical protein [Aquimarina sp. AU58]
MKTLTKIYLICSITLLISCEKSEAINTKNLDLTMKILTEEGSKTMSFTHYSDLLIFLDSKEYTQHLNLIKQKNQQISKGSGEFLDCEKTQIEVTDDGDFITHERCCSKPVNGEGGGTCFDVVY